ncbi:hypothetical protein [Sphingomonas asaccharolytica]|uniref:hypothetical protein n=1 Tax=Sphingomonas asaccharolytica TaxID=40681 RepID=UPI00082C34A6|nr:hypothetical protein [Sphingomonas asaccharolytica]
MFEAGCGKQRNHCHAGQGYFSLPLPPGLLPPSPRGNPPLRGPGVMPTGRAAGGAGATRTAAGGGGGDGGGGGGGGTDTGARGGVKLGRGMRTGRSKRPSPRGEPGAGEAVGAGEGAGAGGATIGGLSPPL